MRKQKPIMAEFFFILTSSPNYSEQIGFEIFSYLPYEDQIGLVSTNHSGYQRWIRKIRCFTLPVRLAELFFIDEEYREEILTKIQDPLKQLLLLGGPLAESSNKDAGECSIEEIEESFHCSGFHLLEIDTRLFDYLMNQIDCCGIQHIEHLVVDASCSSYNKVLLMASHLAKVTTSLTLQSVIFRESLDHCLSLSLTELYLNQCKRIGGDKQKIKLSLPHLPILKKLSVTNTEIENLEQFHYVKELYLEEVSISNLEPFQNVGNLTIKNCDNIVDVSYLQQISNITIENCPNIVDYSPCFRLSRVIAISVADGADMSRKVRLDCSTSPSSSLKDVSLKGLHMDIGLSVFSHVKRIKLWVCDNLKCLHGLEEVESVHLIDLGDLTSLEGLGRNQDVKVERCHAITDFSAIRLVRKVIIAECEGFRNANDVAEVYDLKIIRCSQLSDINVLRKVHSLTVKSCPKISSIISLVEVVPQLIVEGCTKVRKYERLRFDLTERSLSTKNGLTMIPESVYGLIFEFLAYEERIQLISSSPYLYEVLMKKTRQMIIEGDALSLFFSDASFMNEILDYIENPLEQLQLQILENIRDCRSPFHFRDDFYCSGYRRLDVSSFVFKDLCQSLNQRSCFESSAALNQENDWKVCHLIISDGMWPTGSLEDIQQYLDKALISLSVNTKEGAASFDSLSPSLESLAIRQSEESFIMLPFLPKLRSLFIRCCNVLNLEDFHFLQELCLMDVAIDNVEPFKEIKKISIIRCHELHDISSLQSNECVSINCCWFLRDFRNVFSQSKEITIEWSGIEEGEILIDLTNFQCAETINLNAEDTVTQQIMTSRGLPASLKEIVLSGDLRFGSNFSGFHGLERVELKYSVVPLLEGFGLGSVLEVELFKLDHLTSLEGLQDDETGSLRSVSIESCTGEHITSFSPLKCIHEVSIKNCYYLSDLSELDHVHSLWIEDCPNIRDISMLKNVADLTIVECNRVSPLQYRKLEALRKICR